MFHVALCLAFVQDPASAAPAPLAVPVLSHAQQVERMKAVPGATLLPVGRSRAGRDVLAVRVSSGERAGKPAILVVGNVDGSETWTSALALHHAEALARDAATEPAKSFLERADLIVIPCANPDAHERRFATPRSDREATGDGVDDDRDGRSAEDPPSDVDGDGVIGWLRVADPDGEWIEDPADARALLKADAKRGERGRYRLWPEGRDLDGDERVAEDAEKDACVNRNFAEEFQEHAAESGAFAMGEPESRALADFVLAHPEIALAVVYGSYDNLVEKPKSTPANARTKLVPAPGVVEADVELLVELGKRYAELTGNKSKGKSSDAGTLHTWLYAHQGLWTLAIRPWDIPLDAKKPDARKDEGASDAAGASGGKPGEKPDAKKDQREPSDDAKRLVWLDQHPDEGWRFQAWRAFQHPELGAVELGGFAPFARSEPPASASGDIAAKELRFLVSLADELPRVEIRELAAKALGPNLFEIEATIANPARLALQSGSARRTQTVRPLRARLLLDNGAALLGGDDALELSRELGGAGARLEYRWLVRAQRAQDVALSIDTDHAGSDLRRAEVKP